MLDESGHLDLGQGLTAVHLSVPSGIFTGESLIEVAKTAEAVDGEIRLSVEQSLYRITSYNVCYTKLLR